LYVGIRWDEHPARAQETFFSERKDPDHTRIHPILALTEKDIWTYIKKYDVPYCKLYDEGYRSLGEKEFTYKVSDKSATERSGRHKDKEEMMGKLRSFGYF